MCTRLEAHLFCIPTKLRKRKKPNTTILHKQNLKQNIIFLSTSRLVQATNTNKKQKKYQQTYKNSGAA